MFFFGPQISVFGRILVNGSFLAPEETVHFAPWEQLFDFLFPSYGHFRKKKNPVDASKGLPTVGAPVTVTALAVSARRLDSRTG